MASSEDILRALEASGSIADKYSCAVFTIDMNQKPELLGTAIIIERKSKSYLVTAGHVIKQANRAKRELFLAVNNHFVRLQGLFILTEGQSDVLDLGVVALSEQFVSEHKLQSIGEDMICPWEHTKQVFGFSHGYPVSKNKQSKALLGTKTFGITSYSYAGNFIELESTFSKYKKSLTQHSCLSYGSSSNGQKAISPRGKSGGGVWFIEDISTPEKIFLDSILIESFDKPRVIFSTKIGFVLRIIDQHEKLTF